MMGNRVYIEQCISLKFTDYTTELSRPELSLNLYSAEFREDLNVWLTPCSLSVEIK